VTKKSVLKIFIILIAWGLVVPIHEWAFPYSVHFRYGPDGQFGSTRHLGHHRFYGHPGLYSQGYNYYPRLYGNYSRPYYTRGSIGYLGALDLNVKPKKAQVFLNGHFIGVSDNFDGVPRLLWLKEGTYEVIFFKEGFQTVVREFLVLPGVKTNVKLHLQRGKSVPPEELTSSLSIDPDPKEIGRYGSSSRIEPTQ